MEVRRERFRMAAASSRRTPGGANSASPPCLTSSPTCAASPPAAQNAGGVKRCEEATNRGWVVRARLAHGLAHGLARRSAGRRTDGLGLRVSAASDFSHDNNSRGANVWLRQARLKALLRDQGPQVAPPTDRTGAGDRGGRARGAGELSRPHGLSIQDARLFRFQKHLLLGNPSGRDQQCAQNNARPLVATAGGGSEEDDAKLAQEMLLLLRAFSTSSDDRWADDRRGQEPEARARCDASRQNSMLGSGASVGQIRAQRLRCFLGHKELCS
mmetsp:Transcript_2368/g.5118  ORF Transcript_2368/g.5118 Transcript_2368/m.5118 type:complete len:271 (-) Transcript_2368:474-1286(-)